MAAVLLVSSRRPRPDKAKLYTQLGPTLTYIKMIKRQMYGRANPDLLRKRVLLAD